MTGLSAYEKKYGTEAEREARREAQAKARAKGLAERESLERDEEKQLMEVMKASLEMASRVSCCVVYVFFFARTTAEAYCRSTSPPKNKKQIY